MKTIELLSFILLHAHCDDEVVFCTEDGKKRRVAGIKKDDSQNMVVLHGLPKPSELVKRV